MSGPAEHALAALLAPPTPDAWLCLIPLFPLLGAALCGLVGKPLQDRFGARAVHIIAVGAMLLSSTAAIRAVVRLVDLPAAKRALHQHLWTLVDVAPLHVDAAFVVDPLSAVMILVITLAATLIHIYATGYMKGDRAPWRFFAALNLFVFAMLLLVLADSLFLMFFGWEGVGLASYLLIGFWYEDADKAAAGRKAFVTNRIGDWGFVAGLLMLFWGLAGLPGAPTLVVRELAAALNNTASAVNVLREQTLWGAPLLTLVGLAFFLGVAGKSAQIPLYVWLPDAMAGPTPVSALIHAATMVTAGVYLIARLSFLFALSPQAMTVIAVVGVATALLGAVVAVFQTDVKRVLAYSTVSQLGFMILAVGVGAHAAGLFHLLTHACFKACLFLAAGSLIHGMHAAVHPGPDNPAADEHDGKRRGDPRLSAHPRDAQDLRNMGGLRALLPRTHAAYFVGCVAIAGLPVASGFYSKDEILFRVFTQTALPIPGAALGTAALFAAGLTSFYMFRSHYLAFWARPATPAARAHVHESPPVMTVVLLVLAAASVVAGPLLGWPESWGGHPALETFVAPALVALPAAPPSHALAYALQAAGVAVALLGFWAARALYRDVGPRTATFERLQYRLNHAHRALYGKLYVDEFYQAWLLRPVTALSRLLAEFDAHLVDGIVTACAALGRALSYAGGLFDRMVVDGAVSGVATVANAFGRKVARLQTGRLNTYVFGIAAGVAMLTVLTWVLR